MAYKSRVVRPLLPDEAQKMDLAPSAEAVEVRRSILADGVIVAYSYDLIPLALMPDDFSTDQLDGSLFAYLRDRAHLFPHHGVAEIHAVHSEHVGWDDPEHPDLYVLLDQLHYDADGTVLMYSRSYFIEGRYAFTVVRSS
ncbi:UTRA domain-containing protein [Cellulomonas fengjieae]|nr:GntR family transcriptional regulator [Cellulomonas fengjieae]QVI65555.1 GntR family transcriptional regulator [Cellulomonas fengjieae]